MAATCTKKAKNSTREINLKAKKQAVSFTLPGNCFCEERRDAAISQCILSFKKDFRVRKIFPVHLQHNL